MSPVTGPALIRRWAPTVPKRVQPPPPSAWPRYSLDVSNWQRELDENFFLYWTSAGFGGLIVQAVTGDDGRSYTRHQLQAALDHDWEIAAYIWCSTGDAMDGGPFERRADLILPFQSQLHFVALDVEEDGLQVEDVDADLLRCDAIVGDAPFYTGYHVFERLGWLEHRYWMARRLWDSRYDGIASLTANWRPYGGWTERWMKQFTDEVVDQNVVAMS
jgi:hypothetical protein